MNYGTSRNSGSRMGGGRSGGRMNKTARPRFRKKLPKFEIAADEKLDYKNLNLLQRFLTDRGKIVSRRITGITGMQQRRITVAIKRARFLALVTVGSSRRR